MKNIIHILTICFFTSIFGAAYASEYKERNQKLSEEFQYDAAQGYWWYKEKYKDEKTGEEFEVETKLSKKEKMKHDKEEETKKLLKMQIVELKQISNRLDYAYPNITPIYTTNAKTGKKCKTNSSEDCFVFPLQADAQRVPVLGKWLRTPSPTNSKEWLKWESKYFNHLERIALGNRFAFLSEGSKAYKTSTTHVFSESAAFPQGDEAKKSNEQRFIMDNAEKMALVFFLGKNKALDVNTDSYIKMWKYDAKYLKNVTKKIVVPDQESKDYILKVIEKRKVSEADKFYKNVEITVSPETFDKYGVFLTPSVVGFYKNKETKEAIWQIVHTGNVAVKQVRRGYLDFLIYNKIIHPKDFARDINSQNRHMNLEKQEIKQDLSNIYKDTKKVKYGGDE